MSTANVCSLKYKNLTRKKLAKNEIGKRFVRSGNNNFRNIFFVRLCCCWASLLADSVGQKNVG